MDNRPSRVIFTHGWVSRYETHRFPRVDGGQRDPRILGHHIYSENDNSSL